MIKMKVTFRCQWLFDSRTSEMKSWLAVTLYCVVLCTFERTFTFHIHYSIISFPFSLQVSSLHPSKWQQPSCESLSSLYHWPPKSQILWIPLNPHPVYFLPHFHKVHLALFSCTTKKIPQSPLLAVVFTWPLNPECTVSICILPAARVILAIPHGFNSSLPAPDSEISPEP